MKISYNQANLYNHSPLDTKMRYRQLLVILTSLISCLGFSPAAHAVIGAVAIQSFVGEYGGTYYDFTLWHGTSSSLNTALNFGPSANQHPALINSTYMPWLGSGTTAGAWSAAAQSYHAETGMNAFWSNGNSGNSVYAINTYDSSNTSGYYGVGSAHTSFTVSSNVPNYYYFMVATAVTGGANPINDPSLNGFILASPSLTYSAAAPVGVAPEMNGSLIPQVGLLLACLFFLFGRKKENTEVMLAA